MGLRRRQLNSFVLLEIPEDLHLTEAERRVYAAVMASKSVSFGEDDPHDLSSPADWGPERTVRGHVLADLLVRAGSRGQPGLRQVEIQGARVQGVVDLSHSQIVTAVSFERRLFENNLVLELAQTRTLQFQTCVLQHINGLGASIEGLLRITHTHCQSGVHLVDAEVSRSVEVLGSQITGDMAGLAFVADRLKVRGSVFLASGLRAIGAVRLPGAQIGGQLVCSGGQFSQPKGEALSIESACIRGGVLLDQGFHSWGVVQLSRARIGIDLNCSGGRLENQGRHALLAEHAQIENNVFLNRVPATNQGFHANGEVRLNGARIGGRLECNGGLFENSRRRALSADNMDVGGDVLLGNGFRANGEVRLISAKVGCDLDCTAGRFENSGGDALTLDGTDIRHNAFLQDGFHAVGEVRLLGARIGNNLDCTAGRFENAKGDALSADSADIRGNVFLRKGFHSKGTVRLHGAVTAGQLDCSGARFENPKRIALNLQQARFDAIVLRGPDLRVDGHVDLFGAETSTLADDPETLDGQGGVLRLEGFVYKRFAPGSLQEVNTRLKWLVRHTQRYHPQPYDQLAAVFRRNGDVDEAKHVLIAKRRGRRATLKNLRSRWWDAFMDRSVCYGWEPWRPLLLGLVALLIGLGLLIGAQRNGLVIEPPTPWFIPLFLILDVFLPIVSLGVDSNWDIDTDRGGTFAWIVVVYLWFLTLVGWATVTLALAALTGIVKRE